MERYISISFRDGSVSSCISIINHATTQMTKMIYSHHCVKIVRIRSYSGPYFFRIRTEYGEIRSIIFSISKCQNALETKLMENNKRPMIKSLPY